jgi:serine/threonine protein phosphatase PrpC
MDFRIHFDFPLARDAAHRSQTIKMWSACPLLYYYSLMWTLLTTTIDALSVLPSNNNNKVWPSPAVVVDIRITTTTAAMTIPGSDPERPQKVNQDAFFLAGNTNNNNGRNDFIGVMDGHGLSGHLVTRFLQSRFPQRLAQYCHHRPGGVLPQDEDNQDDPEFQELLERQTKDIIELGKLLPDDDCVGHHLPDDDEDPKKDRRVGIVEGLKKAFLAVHLDARRDPTIPTGRSGTTAIVALLDNHNACTTDLYVAGVGDSSALLVDRMGAVQNLLPQTTVSNLLSERRRIERCKGRIVETNVFYGPVGIAMTRALGDTVLLPAGVVPVPLVQVTPLNYTSTMTTGRVQEERYCICLGTDGVFDVLSHARVAAKIQASGILDPTTAGTKSTTYPPPPEDDDDDDYDDTKRLEDLARSICNEARHAWRADLPVETSVDDITCALMMVHFRRRRR